MRTLLIHPSGLMYSEIFLRLEPPGVEHAVLPTALPLPVFYAELAKPPGQTSEGRAPRDAS